MAQPMSERNLFSSSNLIVLGRKIATFLAFGGIEGQRQKAQSSRSPSAIHQDVSQPRIHDTPSKNNKMKQPSVMITNSPKSPDGCVEPGGPAITILQLEVSTSHMLPNTKPKAEGVFSEIHEGRVLQQKQIFFCFSFKNCICLHVCMCATCAQCP
jgi:hypothetical protein